MKCLSDGSTSKLNGGPKLSYTFQSESLRERRDSTYFPDTNFRAGATVTPVSRRWGPNYAEL